MRLAKLSAYKRRTSGMSSLPFVKLRFATSDANLSGVMGGARPDWHSLMTNPISDLVSDPTVYLARSSTLLNACVRFAHDVSVKHHPRSSYAATFADVPSCTLESSSYEAGQWKNSHAKDC
eukprot:4772215-Prymnesium_polylepis.1